MAKILISGCAGFLGSHLCEALLRDGHTIRGVDNFLGGDSENIPPGIPWNKVDCCDFNAMKLLCEGVDIVYHLAAAPHEGLSVFSPIVVSQNTYMSTVVMATAAAYCHVKRFVFTSSMARYGYSPSLPFTEKTPCSPVDPYGISKKAAEDVLKVIGYHHNMEVVIAVPHNIVGRKQKYDDPFRNVASIFINLMLQGRQPFIYGDGKQKRCFSAVVDCIPPLVEMGFKPGLNGEVFNIGPDDLPIAIYTLGFLIADLIGCEYKPIYLPARPAEVHAAWPSSNKARKVLGYETKVKLEQVLMEMIDEQRQKGPKEFVYHLPIELPNSPRIPETWKKRLF